MKTGIGQLGKLAAAVVVVFAFSWVARATLSSADDSGMQKASGTSAPTKASGPHTATKTPSTKSTSPQISGTQDTGTMSPNGAADLSQLDARIKQLKTEYHSELDPLQQQIRAIKDKYDPQISDLEKQRKTLSEERKPASIQDLDQKEEAELAALSDREKDELDKVRSLYQTQRKTLEQKYADERKEVLAHK